MALTRKKADGFVVPSLSDASPAYAELVQKQAELQARQSALGDQRREVEREIAAQPPATTRVSARVAELLGDEADSGPSLQRRLAEVRTAEHDVEEAIEIVRRRLADARGAASIAVCTSVKPEYARRVKAIVAAVMALREAREDYDALIDELTISDVAWTSLKPMQPTFCGDRQDGPLVRYLRDAREAGYHV